ncbi:MAG: methionyl-tRNA formyltransferase [Arachnia propionica]|nr:MAG: methionyl-tRNA formyltransferase [Arachnia propionica]
MRIGFAGTPQVAVPSLHAVAASGHELAAVITRPDAATGRGRKLTASPVAQAAEQLGVAVFKPASLKQPGFAETLASLELDACLVVAYGALLPEHILAIPKHGWINLHFSQLPRWRGAAPVQHAILAGDTTTATSCFRIVKALDAGPVFRQRSFNIGDETAGELLDRLAQAGAAELLATLADIADGVQPIEQPSDGITYASKLTPAEARLDFTRPALALHRTIMACSPAPGAWCELGGQRFKIYRSQLTDSADLAPGQLATAKNRVLVGTGDGDLGLVEVQAPGKRRMAAADWARGGHGEVTLA